MSNALDNITAAAKLRRNVAEVQQELEMKREEYAQRMNRVREGETQLAKDRQELQDTLVQYYKFIQESEVKRSRASKKAVTEEKQRMEREEQIQQLNEQLEELEHKNAEAKERYGEYLRYQTFLEEVLGRNEGDEYHEPKDIISRWMTLQDNTKVLQHRKTLLEEDLLRNKNALAVARQRRTNENVSLQNQLNELQMTLENLQKTIKLRQDELDRQLKHKSATSRTISHLSMAVRNLRDRCALWTAKYSGRGKGETTSDVLQQLNTIGDCLEDFQSVVLVHSTTKENCNNNNNNAVAK
ncbi:flagellar associated protein [Angomonas deanei]|uniref:DUF4200 domain-containing protein n=1 Tax=Angomonas deanei TaxID=59799 RepID=S9V994_9TRYP|nr:flagellar associated protein 73 [Angomonas deanei]EPY39388.1 flagellar associated protein 73 [Angomonas deanei]EPY39578.1 flagellar associated protein 73 [Angomonas deanei]EPY41115.1 flagellar associated protein [Angomonas deanei]CAD2219514.1 Domain of unknown function (DUF4200), putative [Angomonas deanei]|eukprot:EPY37398.1 flagellar associated protein 73 [Angomonas deanei]